MNILVTGGAGYIGSHVVYELISNNYNVIVLDNLSSGVMEAVNDRAIFYNGDICDAKILTKIFQNHQITAVIHLAAKLLVGESVQQPLEYFSVNVGGTINLLKVMHEFGVKNIVFSSTAAVYGYPLTNHALSENDIKAPINPYGSSKLAGEYLMMGTHQAYNLNYVIFRYFNVAGANYEANLGQPTHKKATHLIPAMINSLINPQHQLTVFGDDYETPDQTCVRDYIHVIDVAKAHLLGLQYTLKNQSNIFNLGLNRGYSVKEVIKVAEQVLKKPVKYHLGPRRAGDPAMLIAATNKVQEVLHFQPTYELADMLTSEMAWRNKCNLKGKVQYGNKRI